MDTEATVIQAIKEKRTLHLTYSGKTREVEPHLIGTASSGSFLVRAYQRFPEEGWRLFKVDSMADVTVGEPFTLRASYAGADKLIPEVLAKVQET